MRRRKGSSLELSRQAARRLLKQLDASYAHEERQFVRKRLRAIRLVLLGRRPDDAARLTRAGLTSVQRWMNTVKNGGIEALTDRNAARKRARLPRANEVASMRADIQSALGAKQHPAVWRRLLAVDLVLAGSSLQSAARESGLSVNRVSYWLRAFRREGIVALTAAPAAAISRPSADELRRLAMAERNPQIARRLRAMADLAIGARIADVALRERSTSETVRMWQAEFRTGGVAALRYNWGRSPKLNDRQLEWLRALIVAQPKISMRMLCDAVRERFNLRYAERSMVRLMRVRLGFERINGCFTALVKDDADGAACFGDHLETKKFW